MRNLYEKNVILFLLLNKNHTFTNADSLTKALSGWFDIHNFNALAKEMIKADLINTEIKNKMSHYAVTDEGKHSFVRDRASFETEIRKKYANDSKMGIISTLFDNLL
jgi:hypothetical protein